MDYSFYIRDFLFENKKVSLEGIGSFTLSGSGGSPVQFVYDKKAVTTPELIPFIAEREGKNKVLIESGVEAFLSETRQFMNLGRQWEIDGVGSIQLGKNWQYYLIPVQSVDEQESKRKKTVQRHVVDDVFADHYAEKKTGGKGLMVFVVLIIIIVIGGLIWSFYNHSSTDNLNTLNSVTDTTAVVDTTTVSAVPSPETTAVKQPVDSSTIQASIKKDTANLFSSVNHDTAVYKFVFERTFNAQRAYKRYNQLLTYNRHVRIDSIGTDTPRLYKLYVEKRLRSKDTAAVKDSLQIYFGSPVSIEGISKHF